MSESNPNRDELEDRLLDQALDELLGGKRPPDLSRPIVQAVEAAQPARTVTWRPWAKYALAASLFVVVSGSVAAFMYQRAESQRRTAEVAATTYRAASGTADREDSLDLNIGALLSRKEESRHAGSQLAADNPQPSAPDDLKDLTDNVQDLSAVVGHDTRGPTVGGVVADPNSRDDLARKKAFREQSAGGMGGMGMGGGMFGGNLGGMAGGYGGGMPAGGAGQDTSGEAPRRRLTVDGATSGQKSLESLAGKPASGPQPSESAPAKPLQEYSREIEVRQELAERGATLSKLMVTPRIVIEPDTDAGQGPGQAGDRHTRIVENPFLAVSDNPLSTFSIDVDTASYSKTRRYLLDNNTLPPPDAVRIEELVNYFSYDYSPPTDNVPFAAHVEVAACPWRPEHRLVRIGLKGKEIARDERPTGNLVFLLDVSGSMQPEDRLPRVRRSMRMLVEQLGENDRVAIVVYAGASGLVLPSTPGYDKAKILEALDSLHAGGSTNGGEGIRLAYDTAMQSFVRGGTNRVILCTDGDFNVGTTSTAELERLAEEKAKTGVYLTVLGYGMGNHNDDMLEKLADKGNGNYGYIDTEDEARKLLVDQLGGTLVTIAKDVKIQIEFNPRQVGAFRLVGYENRLLRAEDFNDDKKDAGEIGAGHTVTALYEVAPPAAELKTPEVDPLKYQQPAATTEAAASSELLTLKLRYKEPDGQESKAPLVFPVSDSGHSFGQATADFKFAAAVAGFGMLLRDSAFKGNLTYDAVLELAQESLGADKHGYRAGFVELVRKAKAVAGS